MTTTTTQPAQVLAERFFLAISTQDWPALAQVLTPVATWTFPGHNALSGSVVGSNRSRRRRD